MQIIHPCDTFAKQSGYESWKAVLKAMKGGLIVSGYAPQAGKSIMNIRMFMDQAHKDGLLIIPVQNNEFGLVRVGLRESFSAETLARFDAESKSLEQRIQGQYKTYQP